MKILNRKIFRDLKTLRAQIVSIALLIVCGLSILVSSWSSYQSLQEARDSFYNHFEFADLFSEVVRAPQELLPQILGLDGVLHAETRLIKEGLIDLKTQSEPALGRLISWHGSQQKINKIYLRQGRMPELNHQAVSTLEAVVHEAFAQAHNVKPGDSMNINIGGKRRQLFISGIGLSPEYVYSVSPTTPLPDDKHFGVFWVPHKDLERLSDMEGSFNSVQITTTSKASINFLKQKLDTILERYGNIQAYDRSQQRSHIYVNGEINEQRTLAIIMPVIFLSVAIFILNIILSRLIAMHRAQIATLKALGYSSIKLLIHYFQLVTLILLIGIIPALLVGTYLGQVYASMYEDFFRFPKIDFKLSITTVYLTLMVGFIPGWISAAGSLLKVFSLQPAEALRPLGPPSFQRNLIDRLGLLNRLTSYSKMICRSLLMRPFRLVLSVLGIAISLAIIINGLFFNDVIDDMLNRQFADMRREDLSVRLDHPQSLRVFAELQSIPGVLMTEGERSVPVTLRFKNFKKDISLLGRLMNTQLNRVIDQNGNIITPRPGGILLSRYFEKEFGVKAGDVITLKQLEEKQIQFEVPVHGFVDDMMGQQAYALKSNIHQWLKEMPVSDTIHLKIDSSLAEKIYIALKQRPEIVGVSVRKLMLQGIIDVMAKIMSTFTFVLYLFALAISGAVIFNSARISFSERGWELASLRILGYDTKSTFEILFLEIGIQVLLALPLGLLLGYGLSFLMTQMIDNESFMFPMIVNPTTYATSVMALILILFISGIFLYQKVNSLDFSEALKSRE